MADEFDLTHTAYPSDQDGHWTVWDHLKDEAVRTDLDEAAAVELAAQLRGE